MSLASQIGLLATRIGTEIKSVKTTLAGKANTSHTHVATTDLTATGTKDSTTFLRGDNTWAVPSGGAGMYTNLLTSADQSITGTASTVTGLTFSLPAGAVYEYEGVFIWAVAATTTGWRLGPTTTGSAGGSAFWLEYPSAAAANTVAFSSFGAGQVLLNMTATTASLSQNPILNMARFRGVIVGGASTTTFNLQAGAEVAAGITVKKGTYMAYRAM